MGAALGVYETVLYAEDLDAAEAFYRDIVGLRPISRHSDRGMTFRVDESSVLLVFDPRLTVLPHATVPSHGAVGAGHVAFRVEPGTLATWRERAVSAGVEIEREVDWPGPRGGGGASSFYVRDPAGNSVEFADGEIWPS